MTLTASTIVQKVWGYAHVLKDDGLAFMDYTEQITYLLFLKMAWEQRTQNLGSRIPSAFNWQSLRRISDDNALGEHYQRTLTKLSEQPGLLGLIFTKPQSKINDPAKLRLLVDMIDATDWSGLDVDVKGEVYESLLARNAEDVRGGAGQYFTPRPVIRAIVEIMRPDPTMVVADPACGTGGFLIAAYEAMKACAAGRQSLNGRVLRGSDIVPNVARLCAMNLYLHGIGWDHTGPLVEICDSLASKPEKVDMVLTNPPFGRRSSITVFAEDGKNRSEGVYYKRDDLWATTTNKQLNFVQHVYAMLRCPGRAAIVVPDNVLFEGGAGEKIRRNLLDQSDVHTLLRLPTGIWYSPGVKANVLFFDKGVDRSTTEMWIYDLRTNKNFTLRENPITTEDLRDFVERCSPHDRSKRKPSTRFRRFSYRELLARDNTNLDIFWLKDDATNKTNKLDSPEVLARAIIADLQAAVKEFSILDKELGRKK